MLLLWKQGNPIKKNPAHLTNKTTTFCPLFWPLLDAYSLTHSRTLHPLYLPLMLVVWSVFRVGENVFILEYAKVRKKVEKGEQQ